VLSVDILSNPRVGSRNRAMALYLVLAISSFVHFYLFYQALAVLAIMFLYVSRMRIFLALFSILLAAAVFSYVHWVVVPHTAFSTSEGWIGGSFIWYRDRIALAMHQTVSASALIAVVLCGIAALWVLARAWYARAGANDAGNGSGIASWMNGPALLCIGVLLIVLAAAVTSSTIFAPNFTERNWLMTSPFIWGALAFLYDAGVPNIDRRLSLAAQGLLVVLTLAAGTIVLGRPYPVNQPLREASEWIRTVPACERQYIPTLSFGERSWGAARFNDSVLPGVMTRYLGNFASWKIVFVDEAKTDRLPPEVKAELQRRLDGRGCPILAFSFDAIPQSKLHEYIAAMLKTFRRDRSGNIKFRAFLPYNYAPKRNRASDGITIVYVDR